jgi:3-oxoacyl-[acyl-carrier-protein] synthase-3
MAKWTKPYSSACIVYMANATFRGCHAMTIADLGNSSVATLPTLYDLMQKNKLAAKTLHQGDTILFASVGAGMSINALVYRVA